MSPNLKAPTPGEIAAMAYDKAIESAARGMREYLTKHSDPHIAQEGADWLKEFLEANAQRAQDLKDLRESIVNPKPVVIPNKERYPTHLP